MASVKTGYLFFLAAFLFLSIVPTVAEVVNAVADCNQFLLQKKPPELPGILENGNIKDQNRYKLICQTFDKKPRFLTVYDINNKIPVFSAYKYIGIEETSPNRPKWKIEPQLEGEKGKNMVEGDNTQTYNNQAGPSDYTDNTVYNKGHLYPWSYGSTYDDKKSTMTLTNSVPQVIEFNGGRWSDMEQCIKCIMDYLCFNNNNKIEGFVVTGAEPGNKTLNKRVNIPSIMWSAFCCHNNAKNIWIASAYWDNNTKDAPEGQDQGPYLNKLHDKLGGANLFPGTDCPLAKNPGNYNDPTITKECSKCK